MKEKLEKLIKLTMECQECAWQGNFAGEEDVEKKILDILGLKKKSYKVEEVPGNFEYCYLGDSLEVICPKDRELPEAVKEDNGTFYFLINGEWICEDDIDECYEF